MKVKTLSLNIHSAVAMVALTLSMTAIADVSNALSLDETRHFVQRSGLASPPAVVAELSALSAAQLIDSALNNKKPICPLPPPAWAQLDVRTRPDMRMLNADDRRAARKALRQEEKKRLAELQYWWLTNLMQSENPMAAKMVLFWQNHFTSAHSKVRHAQLMYRQHELFQQHALGNFKNLLGDILRDPAMLIYLDNHSNRKNRPNENLARELLELFTLGEGHYTETDIKESARALTGYGLDKSYAFIFRKKQHDRELKTILGVTAEHNMDSLVELLLEQSQTAQFIVSKLWRTFVSEQPEQHAINSLAEIFRSNNYEIKPLLQALFSRDEFWLDKNRSTLIKSPAQFIADTQRVWQFNVLQPKAYLAAMKNMEQQFFNPPNVRGWTGGTSWINTHTLLARNLFIKRVLKSAQDRDDKPVAGSIMSDGASGSNKRRSENHMTVADIKISLLGDSVKLQNSNTPHSETAVQDILADPGWHLY